MMEENSTAINRTPPHSLEAEQSVIGSMMIDPEAIAAAASILTEEDFYHRPYALLYRAITDLDADGRPIDNVTLQERLRELDAPEELASPQTLAELVSAVPTSTNARHYAKIVADKAQLRRMIRTMETLTTACYADRDTTENLTATMEKQIFQLLSGNQGRELVPISQVVMSALDRISIASNMNTNVTGIPSGFPDLDYKTSGFQRSDLVLVAARPSMGKTAFTLNIASYVAVHLDKPVAFFSLEMSKEQLAQRMLCSEGGIDSQRLRNGDMKDEDWEHVIAAADRLTYAPVFIDDTPGITVMELRSKARRIKAEHGLSMVIIDYLQLMSGKGSKNGDNRQQEISEISRSLKALARELKVPVIALSQLSRSVESRQVKRPMLSDLRESGSLEQDADIVMFLYREDYYDKETEQQNVTEVIVAKHRNGPIDTVRLYFDKEFTRFANFAGNLPDQ